MILPDFKICTKCKEIKSIDEFCVKNKAQNGLNPICRQCSNKWSQQYRLKNKDKIAKEKKLYAEKNKEKLKDKSIQYYKQNRERIKHRTKKNYIDNPEKYNERCRKYYRKTQPLKPVVLCGCGCGAMAMPGRKHVRGHFNRGRKFSKEFCRNMSEAKKNMTDETKRKMSESAKGKVVSLETRRRMSAALNGRIVTKETRDKISEANRGKIHTEACRLANSLRNSGQNHPQWQGGITSLPYCYNWIEYKEMVKEMAMCVKIQIAVKTTPPLLSIILITTNKIVD